MQMKHPSIRICIVEDNRNFARSLEEVILSSEGLECAGIFTSAEECGEAFQLTDSCGVDVILLDLKLPGRSGMSLIPSLRHSVPDAAILVLTSNDDYRTVLEAIQLGAVGYVLKDTPLADLRRAILDVHEGGSVIDPQLSKLVLKAFQEPGIAKDNPLSKRERQVLELMAMGYVKKEVAHELGISYSAVALYTANIYEKLQVPNIAAAVGAAIRRGLI
jgi:DNA-binding NarL/FixJ family response regulator